jgi:site-specific DNA-methyltransferase (adenine-specific)
MFPAKVAHHFIQRYSRPGDLVLDPFSGRGTVPLQGRVEGRLTVSNDLNPLAYVLSRAKAHPPTWNAVDTFLQRVEASYRRADYADPDVPEDIRMLYHPNTLRQICYLRDYLLRSRIARWCREEFMIGGSLAGIMHGLFRRNGTSQYLSISMPNTFSMSPSYVKKYIEENHLIPPDQNVFECLRDKLARLYLDAIDGPDGRTFMQDAASLLMRQRDVKPASVDLIITSPPYLQVVNYGTANWIRLWLLGLDEVGREKGAGRRSLDKKLDHRHTYTSYRKFLLRTLTGIQRVLKQDGVAVLVIGDVADPGKAPLPLAARIWQDIGDQTGLRKLGLIEDDLPAQNKVSRIWGDTKGQATNRDCALVLARKEGCPQIGPETVDWDEPYKDGGPDAVHGRMREMMRFTS